MEPNKERYLNQIRSNTAYPVYRGSIRPITILGHALAALLALLPLAVGLITPEQLFTTGSGFGALVFGSIGAAFIVVLARFWKDAAMILVDLADLTLEANTHGSGGS